MTSPARAPVEVVAPEPGRARVTAVIPCHNRARDAELLLNDLSSVAGSDPAVDLCVLVIDNASHEPLARLGSPGGLRVEHVRLDDNRGGSGGFNAGLALALARGVPCDDSEFVWLIDSDARVETGALRALLRAMEDDDELVAVGSALSDEQGVYEAGGFVNRRTGELLQGAPPGHPVVPCEYAAACSLLVRRWAAERAGPLADLFVSCDDVEWCLRLRRATGGKIAVASGSVVRHPRPDRMRTWARYYVARNAFVPIMSLGLGARVRFRRAMQEVGRAAAQVLVGRDDLAALHLRGLMDAAAGVTVGPAPPLRFDAFRPLSELGPALKQTLVGQRVRRVRLGRGLGLDAAPLVQQLRRLALEPSVVRGEPVRPWRARAVWGGLRRLLTGFAADVSVVSARARPEDWLSGRTLVTVVPEGFVIRRLGRAERAARLLSVVRRGLGLAFQLARRGVRVEIGAHAQPPSRAIPAVPRGSISVVILSHRRWGILRRTLDRLLNAPSDAAGAEPRRVREVIVVDNRSDDGTREGLASEFGSVRIVALDANVGVQGYNEGIRRAGGDYVLVLDDDSWPDPRSLERAARLLDTRPDLAAVALHPRHPETHASEWPYADSMRARDDWPIMGCGNLVRREAWEDVGGYEPAFFLYRNDTDLALKLLGSGRKVHFDPTLVVWHDSSAVAQKSLRWFELATRNWVWVCRRHGRGVRKAVAILAGWGWAHALAGLDPARHWNVLKGMAAGLFRKAPRLPRTVRPDGAALARTLQIRRPGH